MKIGKWHTVKRMSAESPISAAYRAADELGVTIDGSQCREYVNGGQCVYVYTLENGELLVVEEEEE